MQFPVKNTYSVIEVADIKLNHFCMDHRHVIHSEHEFSISKKKGFHPLPQYLNAAPHWTGDMRLPLS